MQTVIIAGGKGTRLGLTDIPKPMVQIAGKPLLEHQVELAKRYGSEEIFILSGHLSNVIIDYFGDGEKFGVKINHRVEPEPLGTAGCIKAIEGELEERFMVFYGDTVMDFDLKSFIEFDKSHAGDGSIGTLLVHPNDHPYDSDLLETDSDNRITGIVPKPHDDGAYRKNLVNAAVYILSRKIFGYIENGKKADFGRDIFPAVVKSGGAMYAYRTAEYIKDMGTPERFESVKTDFVSGKVARLNKRNKRPCVFLDRDGVINRNMDTKPAAADFELLEGAAQAIKKINKSEYLAVVVTNQPMIAKGFVTLDEVELTHKKMETLLGNEGAYLNAIYYCPHHPEKGFDGEIPELKIDCECRKPKPGMLLEAAKEFNIDLGNSWMVGDGERDIQAGKNAGCKTISIGKNLGADLEAESLLCAVEKILEAAK